MAIVLLASYEHPGEYVLLRGETRETLYGPFQSNPNPLLVEAYLRRQLKGREELRFEWAPRADRSP